MARTNYTFQEAAHPCGTGLCPPAADFSGRPLPQDYPACGNPVCRTLPGAENQITHPKWVLCLAQPVALADPTRRQWRCSGTSMVAPAVFLFDYFIHDHGIEHFGSKYPEHTVYAYDILVITS